MPASTRGWTLFKKMYFHVSKEQEIFLVVIRKFLKTQLSSKLSSLDKGKTSNDLNNFYSSHCSVVFYFCSVNFSQFFIKFLLYNFCGILI